MNKIITIILLLAFAGLSIWAYPVVKDRYFDAGEEQEVKKEQEVKEDNENNNDEASKKEEDAEDDDNEKKREGAYLEIEREDCLNKCKNFKDKKELEYCHQVCGLESLDGEKIQKEEEEEASNCEEKSSLEKDYCLKDKAIEEKDYSICREIGDENIRETCKNRISEMILDEQKLNP
jgi:hypothetical protein